MSSKEKAGALLAHPRVHSHGEAFSDREIRRIVSLVPSLSEALVVLGLADRLVGVTEFCVHPKGAFDTLPKVGGTKDAEARAILDLAPDLVIANHEENTARVVRHLAEAGIDVWVTYPRRVEEGARLLRELAGLGATEEAIERWSVPVESAVAAALAKRSGGGERENRPRVFCPIWRDPWMTIARDTYIHDMIELCGGENLFADRGDPGALETGSSGMPAASAAVATSVASRRYPIVGFEEIESARPDVILLPDEPYAFDEADRKRFSRLDCPAARNGRIHLIDGTLLSWYGPRIAEAIRVLAKIFATA